MLRTRMATILQEINVLISECIVTRFTATAPVNLGKFLAEVDLGG